MKTALKGKLPVYFKPILWSYNFGKLDIERDRREIILSAIKYGNLIHWIYLGENYTKETVGKIIAEAKPTEIRPGVRRLSEIIFS